MKQLSRVNRETSDCIPTISDDLDYYKVTKTNGSIDNFWIELNDDNKHRNMSTGPGGSEKVNLTFGFPFYGHIISEMYVSTAGAMSMDADNIVPYIGSFNPGHSNESAIHFEIRGDMFIVEWRNMFLRAAPPTGHIGPFHFQTILDKDGTIMFLYRTVPGDAPHYQTALHSGININITGINALIQYKGTEIASNDIHDNSVIVFTPQSVCNLARNSKTCNSRNTPFHCKDCKITKNCSDEIYQRTYEWLEENCEPELPEGCETSECIPTISDNLDYYKVTKTNGSIDKFWIELNDDSKHHGMSTGPGAAEKVNLTFGFPFYYHTISEIYVSTAGAMSMDADNIVPYIGSFNPGHSNESAIHFETRDDMFIVEWRNMFLRAAPPTGHIGPFHFQTILDKDGTIMFLYRTVPGDAPHYQTALHSGVNIYTTRIHALVQYKGTEIASNDIHDNSVIVFTPQTVCNLARNSKTCNARNTPFHCKDCEITKNCSDEIYQLTHEWLEENCEPELPEGCETSECIPTISDNLDYYKVTKTNGSIDKFWIELNDDSKHHGMSTGPGAAEKVDLTFGFPFYGHTISEIYVSTAGAMSMDADNIVPYIGSFNPGHSNESAIHFETRDDKFIVEWRNMFLRAAPPTGHIGPFHFQTILDKDGTIMFLYRTVPGDTPHYQTALHSGVNIYTTRIHALVQYKGTEIESNDIHDNSVIVFTPQSVCNLARNSKTCNARNTPFHCKDCEITKNCSDEIYQFTHEWLEENCEPELPEGCETSECIPTISDNLDYYKVTKTNGSIDKFWIELNDDSKHHGMSTGPGAAEKVNLTFGFPFYGHTISEIYVSTAGAMSMEADNIVPYIGSFNPGHSNESAIHFETRDDMFIVEWRNMFLRAARPTGHIGPFHFQTILDKVGTIMFLYRTVPGDAPHYQTALHSGVNIYTTRIHALVQYKGTEIESNDIHDNSVIVFTPQSVCNLARNSKTCNARNTPFHCKDCEITKNCSDEKYQLTHEWLEENCKPELPEGCETSECIPTISDNLDYYRVTKTNGSIDKFWIELNDDSKHHRMSTVPGAAEKVNLTFGFPFYGHTISEIYVSTAGAMSMDADYIVPYIGSFNPGHSNESAIHFGTRDNMFIVEWRNMFLRAAPPTGHIGPFHFQTILDKDGTIMFLYRTVPGDAPHYQTALHSGVNIYTTRIHALVQYKGTEIESNDIHDNSVIVFTPESVCNLARNSKTCNARNTPFHCKDCEITKNCSDEIYQLTHEWLEENCEPELPEGCETSECIPTISDNLDYYKVTKTNGSIDKFWIELNDDSKHHGMSTGPGAVEKVNLTFGFPFYGHTISEIYVSTAGAMSMDADKIVPYIGSFNPGHSNESAIHFETRDDMFIVEWRNMFLRAAPPTGHIGPFNFQTILDMDGTIMFLYRTVPGDAPHYQTALHSGVNIYTTRIHALVQYKGTEIESNDIHDNSVIVFTPESVCNLARNSKTCNARNAPFHCKDCEFTKNCSDEIYQLTHEWLEENCEPELPEGCETSECIPTVSDNLDYYKVTKTNGSIDKFWIELNDDNKHHGMSTGPGQPKR